MAVSNTSDEISVFIIQWRDVRAAAAAADDDDDDDDADDDVEGDVVQCRVQTSVQSMSESQ